MGRDDLIADPIAAILILACIYFVAEYDDGLAHFPIICGEIFSMKGERCTFYSGKKMWHEIWMKL